MPPSNKDNGTRLQEAILEELSSLRTHVEQMRDVVFDAVTQLGERFEKISAESHTQQALLEKTLRSVGGTSTHIGGFALFIEHSQDTMVKLLEGLENATQRAVDLAKRLDTTLPMLDELGELSHAVRDSANQIRYLAINATIEAAHAGNAGLGFAVVAKAVQDLALEFKGISARMDANVGNIGGAVRNVADKARTAALADSSLVNNARGNASTLRKEVDGLNQEIADQLRVARNIGMSIQKGVNQCVRGLQFGDLVGQLCELSLSRLEIIEPITEQASRWATVDVQCPDGPTAFLEQFERSRTRIRAVAVQQTSLEAGDVELF